MAGSFTGGGGTLANAGGGLAASTQTGKVVTTAASQAAANARALALRRKPPKWNTGRAPQNVPQQQPLQPAASPQLPAWNPNRAPQNVPQAPEWNTQRAPQNVHSIFGARNTTFRTRPAMVPTRMVRTGEGTGITISNPNNDELPTGTFFSGGSPIPTETLPYYPTGTFFAAGGDMVRGPGEMPATTVTESPFSSYYTGWGRGGGGGGQRYSSVPNWLLNLYNWNYKG